MRFPLIAALLLGCRPPDPAPAELTDLMLFAWRHADPQDDRNEVSLADSGERALAWFDGAWAEVIAEDPDADPDLGLERRLDDPDSQRLTDEDLEALVPPPAVIDGEAAVGIVVARESSCSLDALDTLYLQDDQKALFPDNYESYSRSEQQGLDCFPDCPQATWRSALVQVQQVIGLDVTYTFALRNEYRTFDAMPPDGDTARRGRLLRVWMEDEAVLQPDNLARFIQNMQIELIVEREPGRLLHAYAQWTELRSGELNTEAPVFLNSYVDGLREFMVEVDALCE